MKSNLNDYKPVSHQLTICLCFLFAMLYGVWLLPNTVFTRNICLIAGAVLGLIVIVPRRHILLKKEAIPIWLIFTLLLWVTFHLFFIGRDPVAQLGEYAKSWKKIAISLIFAIGLGLAVASNFKDNCRLQVYWRVIYFGFTLPVIIYFVKLGITTWAPYFGITPSPHLLISREIFTDPFAIHRSGYVFFVMPALAISVGLLASLIKKRSKFLKFNLVYIAVFIITLLLFIKENDRLSYIFLMVLILIALFPIAWSFVRRVSTIKAIMFSMIVMTVLSLISLAAYRQNPQWNTFLADTKMAIQVDRYDNWKYSPEYLPINELGEKVSDSNYKRVAWLIVGSRLTLEYPLGYGLMSQSFGKIGKLKWPDSQMSWAHSAWLDFTLGYGFPAAILFLASVYLAWKTSQILPNPWNILGRWVLGALTLVFIFKEVSSEIYINAFLFLVAMVSGFISGFHGKSSGEDFEGSEV